MKRGGILGYIKTKKFINTAWNEFVYGGHFLALGDVVAIYVLGILLKINVTIDFLAVIYLCVFAANLLNRSDESEYDELTNPIRVNVMRKYTKYFYYIVFTCLAVSAWLILSYSSLEALLFAVSIFLIASLYTFFLKGLTKYIIGFKNYIAALFYSLLVFLLVIYYKSPINIAVVIIFCFYYMRIFISSAICDIKDIEGDKKKGLKTLAIYLGKRKSIALFQFLNMISGLFILYGVFVNLLPLYSLGVLITIPYAFSYISRVSKTKNNEFFSNVVIDGEFLLWLPFMILMKHIL